MSTFVKELAKREKAIRQIRTQFTEEPEEARRANADSESKAAPDSIYATLERMVRQGTLLASSQFSNQLN